jgi:DNA modification methylase
MSRRIVRTPTDLVKSGRTAQSLVRGESRLEWVSTAALKPSTNNARTHSTRQIRQIARSIEEFGFINPILIDEEQRIICGHGRWASAKMLGLRKVPTLRFDHLNEAQKRAYILADNRLAEKAGWDREILTIELQALVDMEFEVELTGFEMGEVDLILDEASQIHADDTASAEDSIPESFSAQPVTKSGDLWLLGTHRLLCGDARNQGAYEDLLETSKADFVFTDPPYNVPIEGNVSGLGRIHHGNFAMACGEMSQPEYIAFLEKVFRLLCAHTRNGAIHDVCMDWRHAFEVLTAGRALYQELKSVCVWNKHNGGMGSFYRSKHELVFVWKSGRAAHVNNFELGQHGRSRTNVWDYPGVNSFRHGRLDELAMHPTVKPVALVADAIRDCSRRGGLVLDPFAGSGTVIIAAERTGRQARMIEIDPAYCDLIIRRWQAYTGKRAIQPRTGSVFDNIEDEIQSRGIRNGRKQKQRKST